MEKDGYLKQFAPNWSCLCGQALLGHTEYILAVIKIVLTTGIFSGRSPLESCSTMWKFPISTSLSTHPAQEGQIEPGDQKHKRKNLWKKVSKLFRFSGEGSLVFKKSLRKEKPVSPHLAEEARRRSQGSHMAKPVEGPGLRTAPA